MAPSRKRLKTAEDDDGGLTSLSDDMLIHICLHLQYNDLASLSSTCKHFGEKQVALQDHSLMEKIAKQMVEQLATSDEKSLLDQRGYYNDSNINWIIMYDKLLMLRHPLLFEQLIGEGLDYVGSDKTKIVVTGSAMHTAISNQVTSSSGGKHYATFTVRGGGEVSTFLSTLF